MQRGEVPGYYYDEEKGKYFRRASGSATLSQKRKQEDVAFRSRAKSKTQSDSKLRRTRLHSPFIISSRLDFEIAHDLTASHSQILQKRAFVSGLSCDGVQAVHDVEHISQFVYDEPTRCLIMGAREPENTIIATTTTNLNGRYEFRRPHFERLRMLRSSISSASLSTSRIVAATSFGEEERPAIVLMKLAEPYDFLKRLEVEFSVEYSYNDVDTIWSSAANPFIGSSHATFAVGMNRRVGLFSDAEGHWDDARSIDSGTTRAFNGTTIRNDVRAVEWLTANVLAYGRRKESIGLWDLRTNGKTNRIRFQQSVESMRRIDDSRLVVQSHRGLSFYDLRMVDQASSEAYLNIKNDQKSVGISGMDVNTRLGIVAEGRQGAKVELFSLRDGENLGEVQARGCEPDCNISCLEFVHQDGWEDALLGSCGNTMVEWAW